MSTADDELRRACEARAGGYPQDIDTDGALANAVLDALGRIGPVTAWVLALREHRKRVENDTGSPLPDQSQWAWKDNNHVG